MSHIVFSSPKFLQWKERLELNGITIENVEVLGVISRDTNSLFAAFLDCRLLTPEGAKIPRCVLIGGDSVVIVPVLTCKENGEVYTLMVSQRRILDGNFAEEFPAGGIDLISDDPKETACQELREELDINVLPEELILLDKKQVKINPSFSDGLVYFFYFEREVSLQYLQDINERRTGCHDDGEYINIKVKKMSHVVDAMTSSALIGVKLLERAMHRVF